MTRDPVRLGRITMVLNAVVGFVAVALLVWALVDLRAEAQRAATRAQSEVNARAAQTERLLEENERLLRELARRSARHDRLLLELARRGGIPTEGLAPQSPEPEKAPKKKPPKKPPPDDPGPGPGPGPEPSPIVCLPAVGCVERREP